MMHIKICSESKKNGLPIKLSLFGMFCILVATPFNLTMLGSIGTWSIVLSMFFCIYYTLRNKMTGSVILNFLFLILFSMISFVVSYNITYESLVKIICFFELPVFVLYFDSAKNQSTRKEKTLIYVSFLAVLLFFVIVACSDKAYVYTTKYRSVILDALTLGYANPNETGMYLMITTFVLMNANFFFRKKSVRMIFLVATCISIYLMLLTKSRICILLTVLAILFVLFKLYTRKTFLKILPSIGMFAPICFLAITIFGKEELQSIMILGDDFETGRFNIYMGVFENISFKDVLLGNYQNYPLPNLHNVYLTIFASFGVLTLLAYGMLLRKFYVKSLVGAQSNQQSFIYIVLCLLLVHGAVESAIFIGGSAYSALFIALVCLSQKEEVGTR